MPDATTTLALAESAGSRYGFAGYALVILIVAMGSAAFWLVTRNTQRRETADTDGQMDALGVYKEMLANERKAKEAADARADSFYKLYSDALMQLGKLTGELTAVKQQLDKVTAELEKMRGQLDATH